MNSNTIYTHNWSAKYAIACRNSLCEYWSSDHSPTTGTREFLLGQVGGVQRRGDVLWLIQYSSMPQWPAGTTSYFQDIVCENAAYKSHCLCIIVISLIIINIDVRTIRDCRASAFTGGSLSRTLFSSLIEDKPTDSGGLVFHIRWGDNEDGAAAHSCTIGCLGNSPLRLFNCISPAHALRSG